MKRHRIVTVVFILLFAGSLTMWAYSYVRSIWVTSARGETQLSVVINRGTAILGFAQQVPPTGTRSLHWSISMPAYEYMDEGYGVVHFQGLGFRLWSGQYPGNSQVIIFVPIYSVCAVFVVVPIGMIILRRISLVMTAYHRVLVASAGGTAIVGFMVGIDRANPNSHVCGAIYMILSMPGTLVVYPIYRAFLTRNLPSDTSVVCWLSAVWLVSAVIWSLAIYLVLWLFARRKSRGAAPDCNANPVDDPNRRGDERHG